MEFLVFPLQEKAQWDRVRCSCGLGWWVPWLQGGGCKGRDAKSLVQAKVVRDHGKTVPGTPRPGSATGVGARNGGRRWSCWSTREEGSRCRCGAGGRSPGDRPCWNSNERAAEVGVLELSPARVEPAETGGGGGLPAVVLQKLVCCSTLPKGTGTSWVTVGMEAPVWCCWTG